MKRIINYCEKNGINYEITKMGGNYFKNAPALYFDAIQITIWYDSEKYNEQKAGYNKAVKYSNRYGYKIINAWHNTAYDTVIIGTKTDAAALELYLEYQLASVQECEQLAHNYYTGVTTGINLNNEMGRIMNKYGLLYNTAKQEQKTA